MNSLEELKNKLGELFQFDRSDLDFGIYRIMNQKKEDVEKFLNNDLIPQVKKEFDQYKSNEKSAIQKELEEVAKKAKESGFDPEQSPRVKELKEKITQSLDVSSLENEVYSHLYNFFSRYYDKGDFISLRRYKKDTYSIPYEGEEVKLYWANYDQYYIKSSENFKNYRFKLSNGKSVNYNLAEATTEKNNNKTQNGKERRFYLASENTTQIIGDELTINFIYDLNDEKQDTLNDQAIEQIIKLIQSGAETYKDFYEILSLKPTEKNKNRTLLEKHLNDYVAKNTFDYFIHKDLGNFLRRELDFFIKNEVLFIDDLDTENERKFDAQISTVKVIKKIGHKIITFLGQLEDFQKKLWLKKKFVYGTNYCMTLDFVPEEFYAEIANNKEQIKEWINLFAIDEIETEPAFADAFNNDGSIRDEQKSTEFLKNNQLLVLDTKFLAENIRENILATFDNLDKKINGILVNSDNFHGINNLSGKYRNKLDSVYIDPPYNAKSSEIMYKNTFKHSSWNCLMANRISLSKNLLNNSGCFECAIDENEQENLGKILSEIFNDYSKTCVSVIHNPRGIQGNQFSYTHEFAYFVTPENKKINNSELDSSKFKPLMKTGGESARNTAKNCFYPILIKDDQVVGAGDVPADDFHPESGSVNKSEHIEIWPIDSNGGERKWRYSRQSFNEIIKDLRVSKTSAGKINIDLGKNSESFKTVWTDAKYNAAEHGSNLLKHMGISSFSFPKSIHTVIDCISSTLNNNDDIVLDYFAGSGTTGHAVIRLNKADKSLKFILIEMGLYFNSVLKPRILKAIYSDKWKDGKPLDNNGSARQIIKYFSLEQYEDSLENLEMKKNNAMTLALDDSSKMREEYTLRYILDVETKESDSLLNLEKFEDPFNYKMKIIKDNEITWEKMDLVETFSYLIGISVDKIDNIRGFKTVTGNLPDGQRALIIWRNLKEKTNAELDEFCQKQQYTTQDSEFDVIYVNGDNNLINVEDDENQRFKVALIEDEFKKRMFGTVED